VSFFKLSLVTVVVTITMIIATIAGDGLEVEEQKAIAQLDQAVVEGKAPVVTPALVSALSKVTSASPTGTASAAGGIAPSVTSQLVTGTGLSTKADVATNATPQGIVNEIGIDGLEAELGAVNDAG
jgi:hypothetical protein